MAAHDISVRIGIGACNDFIITESGDLQILRRNSITGGQRINLGKATKSRFEALVSHLERLKIHATDA